MYDIVIVGAGPAGLTAAIYARRAAKRVLILEAKSYGGAIINTLDVENYPGETHISGYDLATKLFNQAKSLGAEIIYEEVIKINNGALEKEVVTNKNKYKTKAIILATGSENRKLGLDRENEFVGKGISYCATCDGAFYKNKEVAVVGGGNTALGEALYLSNIASKVYLIHRKNGFRGEVVTLRNLKQKGNIEFIYNSNIKKLNGNDKLESIEVIDDNGMISEIQISGLFIAIGRQPKNQKFDDLIELDSDGYIISSEDCKTNINGIYVAGDSRRKKVRQLVTATADGAVAAIAAIDYINNICN